MRKGVGADTSRAHNFRRDGIVPGKIQGMASENSIRRRPDSVKAKWRLNGLYTYLPFSRRSVCPCARAYALSRRQPQPGAHARSHRDGQCRLVRQPSGNAARARPRRYVYGAAHRSGRRAALSCGAWMFMTTVDTAKATALEDTGTCAARARDIRGVEARLADLCCFPAVARNHEDTRIERGGPRGDLTAVSIAEYV